MKTKYIILGIFLLILLGSLFIFFSLINSKEPIDDADKNVIKPAKKLNNNAIKPLDLNLKFL